jgi:hypothetical protein
MHGGLERVIWLIFGVVLAWMLMQAFAHRS